MTQEVRVGENLVILDSEVYYSGKDGLPDEEKLVRKAVSLPVTKQLVYYKNTNDAGTVVQISKYRLVEMYDITERWYTIEIIAEDGTIQRIHSSFLAEMQKPSFITDLAQQKPMD